MVFRISLIAFAVLTRAFGASGADGPSLLAKHRSLQSLLHYNGRTGFDNVNIIERQLRPIFQSLPRKSYHKLDSSGVRYLLYRHFWHERAWLIRGLVPDGGSFWNSSFPTAALDVSRNVQFALGRLLDERGLSLQETAVLASFLEAQVHKEAEQRLRRVWQEHDLELDESTNIETLESVLDLHAVTYLLPEIWKSLSSQDISVSDTMQEMANSYPRWSETQMFLRDAMWSNVREGDAVNYRIAHNIVVQVMDQFGRWQDRECLEMKHRMVALETDRPGRIDLARFYGESLKGVQPFNETVPYLRVLGALDETDPQRGPAVLITNYVLAANNHFGAARTIEISCVDECLDILGYIERRLGKAEASVEEMASAVQSLPAVPTASSEELVDMLNGIAEMHQGVVPLHGRPFALWLHTAYPRTCPYPHHPGTTRQIWPEVFEDEYDLKAFEKKDDIPSIIDMLAFQLQEKATKPSMNTIEVISDSEIEMSTTPRNEARTTPMDEIEVLTDSESQQPITMEWQPLAAVLLAMAMALASLAVGWSRRGLGASVAAGPLLDVAPAQGPAREVAVAAASSEHPADTFVAV